MPHLALRYDFNFIFRQITQKCIYYQLFQFQSNHKDWDAKPDSAFHVPELAQPEKRQIRGGGISGTRNPTSPGPLTCGVGSNDRSL